jgi:HEAT repeat protein
MTLAPPSILLVTLIAGSAVAQPPEPSPRQTGAGAPPAAIAPRPEPAPLDEVAQAQLRERAISVLADLAQSPQPEVRANALEALIPVPTRLEPIVRRALVDESAGVRAVAAMAAGKAGVVSVADFIRPLVNDPSPLVQASAILGLSRLALSPAGQRAGLQPPDPSPLARMLWSSDARERSQAAFVLGELGNASALPMLREARRQPMRRASTAQARLVQLQIAEAMAKLGDDTVLGDIRAALYPAAPDDLEAAALAAQIVGQVGDKQSTLQLDYLCRPRQGPEGPAPAEVRLAAAGALSKLGDPLGLPTADEFLTSPTPSLRAQAALVYGEYARRTMLSVVAPLLDDADPQVRAAAGAAILKMAR